MKNFIKSYFPLLSSIPASLLYFEDFLLPDVSLIDIVLFSLWWVSSVCQLIQVIPVRRGLTVDIVVPITDTELLIEAGLIGTHVWDPSSILITHVEYHAIKLQVSIKSDSSVGAVKGEGDIRELCPPLLL